MQRRQYLTALSAVALAGCMNSGNGGSTVTPASTPTQTATPTTTQTRTQTQTETETETPTTTERQQQPPEVTHVSAVAFFEDSNVFQNEIESAGAGGPILIGWAYNMQSHDGSVDATHQINIYDEDDNRITQDSADTNQLSGEGDSYTDWSYYNVYDTEGWGTGQYTAEVIVRDDIMDVASSPRVESFELLDPITSSDRASLVNVDAPDELAAGDIYAPTLTFENHTSRDNTLTSPISWRLNANDWVTYEEPMYSIIPAGERREYNMRELTLEREGRHFFRLDALGATWSVRVE